MTQSALSAIPELNGLARGPYNGVETALRFSDVASELEALRTGCGVFDLSWRTLITASGKDRVRWLHNMVTNNIRDVAVNRGCYNFVLSAQGRIQGDLYVFNLGEMLLLETDRTQVDALLPTLKRYIIMDKVELVPVGDSLTAIGVSGPKAEAVLRDAGIDASGMEPLETRELTVGGAGVRLIRGPQQKSNWYELWIEPARVGELWKSLVAAGAEPVGAEALEIWRVLRGIPQYGIDIRDRDLPQETEQLQALHFSKGCYIGQEIVERIRARGQVHRTFTGFEFEKAVPSPGKYDVEGRTVAEITTVAPVPAKTGERMIGLGYVRRESGEAGSTIDLNGAKAKIVALPFEN
ncbi:MAG TPA: folate-binding protein [Candidatus Angelobacter sp.]|jgi:folate-binding protein YgfZ|nr:folate-binding protein [Candidatus Angelobacter sp.]